MLGRLVQDAVHTQRKAWSYPREFTRQVPCKERGKQTKINNFMYIMYQHLLQPTHLPIQGSASERLCGLRQTPSLLCLTFPICKLGIIAFTPISEMTCELSMESIIWALSNNTYISTHSHLLSGLCLVSHIHSRLLSGWGCWQLLFSEPIVADDVN